MEYGGISITKKKEQFISENWPPLLKMMMKKMMSVITF